MNLHNILMGNQLKCENVFNFFFLFFSAGEEDVGATEQRRADQERSPEGDL